MSPLFWQVTVSEVADRQLDELNEDLRFEAFEIIGGLAEDPFPPGSLALRHANNQYRIRFGGHYRILYRVDKRARKVLVWRVRHRSDAYDGMQRW